MLGKIIESITNHLCAGQRNAEDSGRVGWQFTGASGDSDTAPLSDSHNYRQEVRTAASCNHGPWNHSDFLNHSNNRKVGQGKNNIRKPIGRENIKCMLYF